MVINLLVDQFIEELVGQSDTNRRNYHTRLRLFRQQHGQKIASEITSADINAWHRAIKSRDYQPATQAGYRQALKAFFNWLIKEGEISKNPTSHLKIGSFIPKRPKLPAERDVEKCREVALAWSKSDQPRCVRDGLIWLISYASGCRLGEIRNLQKNHVANSLNTGPRNGVYWVSSNGKTEGVLIGFTEEVAEAFHAWVALRPRCEQAKCFIGTKKTITKKDSTPRYRPLSREAITDSYRRVSKAAGIRKPILSHALRHRKGDLVTRQQGPKIAAKILNHSDCDTAATAIAYYHHPDQRDIDIAIAKSFQNPKASLEHIP